MEPSLFYTGLVAELYGPLRASVADPAPYAQFIALAGEPALELGCGDGHPLLELRSHGIDVEGLDSSPDMLERCRRAATQRGLEVVLHHQPMEAMRLPRRFRSIFLAGPTFNLLPDDDTTLRALVRIREHLDQGGSALIPLFLPAPTQNLGQSRKTRAEDGSELRITAVSEERDEQKRRQTTVLRYERRGGEASGVVERPWVLHWHEQEGFRALAAQAGLQTQAVLDPEGAPATEDADGFAFWLTGSSTG